MTNKKRREFLATAGMVAGAFCAGSTISGMAHAGKNHDCKAIPAVIHMVYFWLKNPDSDTDRDALIAGLNSLRAIPQIQALHVGVPASTIKRDVIDNSYQVSELMMFNSVDDQDSYQTHPLHEKFVEKCAHLWSKVVVYDSVSA